MPAWKSSTNTCATRCFSSMKASWVVDIHRQLFAILLIEAIGILGVALGFEDGGSLGRVDCPQLIQVPCTGLDSTVNHGTPVAGRPGKKWLFASVVFS